MAPERRAADVIGDPARLDKLISYRLRSLSSTDPSMDSEDIRQAGWLGAVKAAVRWDPEHHAAYETYAYHRIRGQALDELRTANGTRRSVRVVVTSLDKETPGAPPFDLIDERADDPLTLAVDADTVQAIRAEIDVMPEPHRSIVLALRNHDLTPKGIAALLCIKDVALIVELQEEAYEWLRFRLKHRGILDAD